MSYRPLPESLTIKKSELHGLGVFAIQPIPKDTCIGQSHLVLAKQIYRTPIGGFINHSDDQNWPLMLQIQLTVQPPVPGQVHSRPKHNDLGIGPLLL